MNALEMAIELFDLQGVWFQYIELSVWHAQRRNITALSLCNCIWHATCLVAYAHKSAALFSPTQPGTTSEPDFQRPRCWCCTDSVVGIGHLAGKDFMALQRDSSQCLPPPDACLCHRRYPFDSQSEVAARHHAASAENYSTSRPANGECTLQKFPLSPSMTSLRESTKHCKPGVPWLGGDAVSHRCCRRPQLRSDRASR
jgi:hypothetical protein